MNVHIDLAGCGTGARRQFQLLRSELVARDIRLVADSAAETVVYWNAYEPNEGRLRARAKGRRLVCRVGGWHPETAEVTSKTLAQADSVFFVSETDKEYAKALGWKLPGRRAVIRNASKRVGSNRRKNEQFLLIRHGNIGNTFGKERLDRMYSIVSLASVWDRLRRHYPELRVWILGTVDRVVKKQYTLPGWRYLGKVKPTQTVGYGRRALGLVHMVVSDHSPNSVAEAIGEGCPVIVPDRGGAAELAGSGGAHVPMLPSRKGTWDLLGKQRVLADERAMFLAVASVVERQKYWAEAVRLWHRKRLRPAYVADRMARFLRGERLEP
jgi:hypothetical protein